MAIGISQDGRHFVHSDGRPFFYLADTAWMLLNRVSKEDTVHYLRVRAEQGFTVIAAVALAEFGGLSAPNAEGELPLKNAGTVEPNPVYFDHIDYVIAEAAKLGLQIALLPAWGDKVQPWNGGVDGIFSPGFQNQGREQAMAKAYAYGAWIAARFDRHDNIIWINGGDRGPSGPNYAETGQEYWDIWDAMGRGICSAAPDCLISFHPPGGYSSSYWFHHSSWLSFNQIQSGHWNRDIDNYAMIKLDYNRLPVRPTLDGEPCYENHPVQYRLEFGVFNDYDARKKAYHALFAGAAGHTYGAHEVFQFFEPGQEKFFGARLHWKEALLLPGARQMGHLRKLFESLPQFPNLEPAPSFVLTGCGHGTDAVYALKDAAGTCAVVYTTAGNPFIADLSQLSEGKLAFSWYSPRTGDFIEMEQQSLSGPSAFVSPNADPGMGDGKQAAWLPRVGNDWVLVCKAG